MVKQRLDGNDKGHPQVTRITALSMQVCVPTNYTDDQVKEFADRANGCGTETGWCIRKHGHRLLGGAPERQPCAERKYYVHIMLDA